VAAGNPDLLGDALGVAVQERGESVVAELIAQLPQTSDARIRNAILFALSSTEDPALAEQVRNFALDRQVKVGEMAMLLSGSRETPAQRDAAWKWSVAHYDQIVQRTGSFAGGRLPGLMGGGGCAPGDVDRLQAFFQPRLKDITGAARGLAQTSESIQLCSALKSRQAAAAIDAMR
jgi:alanyl aminopeptidase